MIKSPSENPIARFNRDLVLKKIPASEDIIPKNTPHHSEATANISTLAGKKRDDGAIAYDYTNLDPMYGASGAIVYWELVNQPIIPHKIINKTPQQSYWWKPVIAVETSTSDDRADGLVQLIQSWIDEGDADEQRETLEYLIHALDEDRLSNRKLFPKELKGKSW